MRHQPEEGVQLFALAHEATMRVLAFQSTEVVPRPLPGAVHHVAEYLGFCGHGGVGVGGPILLACDDHSKHSSAILRIE